MQTEVENLSFCSCPSITVVLSDELRSASTSASSNSRSKKRRGGGNNNRTKQPSGGGSNSVASMEANEWTSLSPKSLWKQINEEAMAYYKFDLNSDNVDGMQKSFI